MNLQNRESISPAGLCCIAVIPISYALFPFTIRKTSCSSPPLSAQSQRATSGKWGKFPRQLSAVRQERRHDFALRLSSRKAIHPMRSPDDRCQKCPAACCRYAAPRTGSPNQVRDCSGTKRSFISSVVMLSLVSASRFDLRLAPGCATSPGAIRNMVNTVRSCCPVAASLDGRARRGLYARRTGYAESTRIDSTATALAAYHEERCSTISIRATSDLRETLEPNGDLVNRLSWIWRRSALPQRPVHQNQNSSPYNVSRASQTPLNGALAGCCTRLTLKRPVKTATPARPHHHYRERSANNLCSLSLTTCRTLLEAGSGVG